MAKIEKIIELLKSYEGNNSYILASKKKMLFDNEYKPSQFEMEYITMNYDANPIEVNKIVKLSRWFGGEFQKIHNLDFTPKVIKIYKIIGETQKTYHALVQYRKSVEPSLMFIPKIGIITDIFVTDFNNLEVDFDKYDKLSMEKDVNRKLKDEQKTAVKFLLSRKKCILADDMGLGKTTSLSVAAIEGNFDAVLIICPASIKTTWKKELMWYVPEDDITIIERPIGKSKEELEKFLGYEVGKSNKKMADLILEASGEGRWKENKFVILNYDILDDFYKLFMVKGPIREQRVLDNSPLLKYIYGKKSLVIIDEAHKLSNNTSTRYKVIRSLIKKGSPDSVYLATGTPVINNPQGLYFILRLIENSITSNYERYMEEYCGAMRIPINKEESDRRKRLTNDFCFRLGKPNWYTLTDEEKAELQKRINRMVKMRLVARPECENLDELSERLAPIYLRRVKEDLGSLPEKRVHELFYDLTLEEMVEYDRLWDEYSEQKKTESPNVKLNKDLLEGAVYRSYLSNKMVPHTTELVDKLINEGRKVVIACCYDEELYTLQEYYGEKCVIYNGKMDVKKKDEAVEKFKNNPDIMVFIGNIDAASMGLTLVVSHDVVFNNISYTAALDRQMEDRVYRIGQTKPVDIYYQIFNDTQYKRMWDIVLRKDLLMKELIKKESDK